MAGRVNAIAEACYAWEAMYVEPKARAILSRDQCRGLVKSVAMRENMPIPKVEFMSVDNLPCYARVDTWSVHIADWGHTPVTILHEMAHLATLQALLKGEDPHGPAFIAKCIDYYHHFLRIPIDPMKAGARKFGLKIGDTLCTYTFRPKENQFDDLEF